MKYIFGNNNLISNKVPKTKGKKIKKRKKISFNRRKGQEGCVRENILVIRIFEYLALGLPR